MIAIVGYVVVMVAVFGGFAMAGGPFAVLLAWSEWVVICGTAVGTVLVSTPPAATDQVELSPASTEATTDGVIPTGTIGAERLRTITARLAAGGYDDPAVHERIAGQLLPSPD